MFFEGVDEGEQGGGGALPPAAVLCGGEGFVAGPNHVEFVEDNALPYFPERFDEGEWSEVGGRWG
jgi:hypothetical protein